MWSKPELHPERYRAAFDGTKLTGLCLFAGLALMVVGTGSTWAVGFLLLVLSVVGWLVALVAPWPED